MLELHTFGGLELHTGEGERVDTLSGRTKCVALLAYLTVEAPGGRVSREQVASVLWPGRTDDRARTSLRVALSQIRQATDNPLLAGNGTSSLGLVRDRVWADVTAFREALEAEEPAQALELYEGDFLAGVQVQEAHPFQRWADQKRGHLRQQAYEAALSLGASAREAGDLVSAEDAFRRAVDLAPLREEAAGKLIQTLADRGRTADAVQLYEGFRERREAELEMVPSAELQERVAELKRDPPAALGIGAETTEPAGDSVAREVGSSSRERETPESVRVAVRTSTEVRDGGPSVTSSGPAEREPSRWGRFRRRTLLGAVVAVGLLGGLLAGAWYLLGEGEGTAAAAAGDRSVAVLPFEATGTEDPGPIAAGLHSDLLTRLSNVSELKVISATSVERFRDADVSLPAIADSLGVTWVLEGHVQRAGDDIEVHAQLIDPRTDTHAWAETYRRELTAENLFELQSDITRRVTAVLETRLTAGMEGRLDRRATTSLDAHRFYVRGRSLLEQRNVPEMRRALDYFEQALARDSSYALAWAGKADALLMLVRFSETDADSLASKAAEAIDRALAVEPDLAEAHVARARLHMYGREGAAAFRDLKKATELRPSYAAAHAWLAKLQLSRGRPKAALAPAQRSVELDPISIGNQGALVWTLLANGRAEEALDVARRIAEFENGPDSYQMLTLSHLRRTGDLKRVAESREQTAPESLTYRFFRAASGDTAAAAAVLAEVGEDRFPLLAVVAEAARGRTDRAFERMNEAFPREEWSWEFPSTVWLRYFWPETLEPLRDDPRYERFIHTMNTHWGLNPDGSLP